MDEAQARRDRLAKQMQELLPSWSLAKVVTGIQALRGGAMISAIILVAEIGDFNRFANPRQIKAYLGPTPSERSSGAKTARGAITKAGLPASVDKAKASGPPAASRRSPRGSRRTDADGR